MVLFTDWYNTFGWALWINLILSATCTERTSFIKSVLSSLRPSNVLTLITIYRRFGTRFYAKHTRVLHVINYNQSCFSSTMKTLFSSAVAVADYWKHSFSWNVTLVNSWKQCFSSNAAVVNSWKYCFSSNEAVVNYWKLVLFE